MKQRINFKTIYLIATITVGLLGLAIGSTYAIFTTSAEINNPISLSTTLISDDDVFDVIDIVIEPYDTITKTIKIVNSSNSTVNFAIWYLNNFSDNSVDFGINGVPSGTLNVSSNESRIVNIRNKTSNQITITIEVASSKKSITLADSMVIYPNQTLPENIINQQAAKYITNLYETSTKTTVTNNSINYNYAISKSLMNDRKGSSSIGIDSGNIRYYGADPNNYVYFNCNSYNSQNSSSCEKWRIIGVFDGKLKLIRSGSIGTYAWDNKNTSSGASTAYGESDWSNARLMKLMNSGFYELRNNLKVDSGLYYNASSGYCYAGAGNGTKSCSFTTTGLKNNITRYMIASANWNLGGTSSKTLYANQLYTSERGTAVYSGHTTMWQGKVALPYASDYAYAAAFGNGSSLLCSSNINSYSSTNCKNNNWLYTQFKSGSAWLITPYSGNQYDPWLVDTTGIGNYGSVAYNANAIYPTVYLNPDIVISKGTGTSDEPYQLSADTVTSSQVGEYFNGYTSYKNLDFAYYDFGSSVSVIAKFKIDDYPIKFADIVANWETGGFGLVIDTDKKLKFGIRTTTGSDYVYATSSGAVSLNQWHTAVGTYDGTTIKVYLDGSLVGSTTISGSIKSTSAQIAVGADPYTGGSASGEYFPGYVSEVSVIDQAIGASTIATYFSKSTPSTTTYTNTKTLIKAKSTSLNSPTLVKNSIYRGKYFDGTNIYLTKGFANTSLGSKLSVVVRFKVKSFPSDYMELVANTESAGFDIYVSSDKKLYFDIMPSSSSSYSTINSSSSSSLSTDTWYVVVGTYDGTTQKLYLNGTLVASKSLSGSIKTSTTPIYIGADPSADGSANNLFVGTISDVIVIKDALAVSTITSNYANNVNYVNNSNTIINESW